MSSTVWRIARRTKGTIARGALRHRCDDDKNFQPERSLFQGFRVFKRSLSFFRSTVKPSLAAHGITCASSLSLVRLVKRNDRSKTQVGKESRFYDDSDAVSRSLSQIESRSGASRVPGSYSGFNPTRRMRRKDTRATRPIFPPARKSCAVPPPSVGIIRSFCIILDPDEGNAARHVARHTSARGVSTQLRAAFASRKSVRRCIIYDSPIASCRIPVTADMFDAECDMENGWVMLG